MANELNNTAETNTQTEQKTETNTVDLKELQIKIKALEAENGKLKQSVTSASADASKWKQQYKETDDALKAKMSDEERAKKEQDEATAAMQKELETLRTERNIAKISGALVANDIGMDAETANKVAEAMNAGETDKVLDGIRQFVINHDKALKESAIMNNPTLPGGKVEPAITFEQFRAMDYEGMADLKAKHPELYNEYMNKIRS